MTDKEKTKDKIIKVANELFAEHGFEGTSIRDIAKKADVNLSAINYHFENKENLYCEICESNGKWMSEGINQLGEDPNITTVELTLKAFDFFHENGNALMNSFKIFLTTSVALGNDVCGSGEDFGPPGREAFLKVITRDVGEEVSLEKRRWAMRMIFADLVHFSVMLQSPIMKSKAAQVDHFKKESIEQSLKQLVIAVLNHLKTKWK